MLIRTRSDIPSSEITPQETFRAHQTNRRKFLAGLGAAGAAALLPRSAFALDKLNTVTSPYKLSDAMTPEYKAQHYNNFYEFGTSKSDPAEYAGSLKTRPWTVKLEGLVEKPQTVNIDDLLHYKPIEQRIYRFRCVEAWSMIIPWDGYPLSNLIEFAKPLPSAKFVQFTSLANSKEEKLPFGFDWPYREGLRMDEAMHPLTLLTFGSYGETLANQQGAPIRVIVPWKYGFKSAKSIVSIKFMAKMPSTTWNDLAPSEYGFYSNVNPDVSQTPWSQARERRIDSSFFPHEISTQPFNGYGNEVAGLYAGMNLKKDF